MSYCLGGLPKTPPAYIFTFSLPFAHVLTFSAHAPSILLAMKAFGGSKVANLSSVADAELNKLKEKTPNKKPISFFLIIFPPNKLIYFKA